MYIHSKPNWPHFTWQDEQLTPALASIHTKQGYLLGRMSTLGFELQGEATLEVLTAEITQSHAIEGEQLNSDKVRSSVAKNLGIEQSVVAAQDHYVESIVEVMLDATQNYDQALTRERLFAWHAALFPTHRSCLRKITVGNWRKHKIEILSGPIGKEIIHFEAPEAELLENEVQLFLTWFNEEKNVDPLLKAGIAHFWFVTIHPFDDGNGRISRAIADMCLAQADQSKQRFYSLSASIEKNRDSYYQILETSQKGELDITAWLQWFLDCLHTAIENADSVLDRVLHKAKTWQHLQPYPINERQRKIINRLLDGFEGKLTTSKYAKIVKCSQDTALRDVQLLVEHGILTKSTSGGRSTSYELINHKEIL